MAGGNKLEIFFPSLYKFKMRFLSLSFFFKYFILFVAMVNGIDFLISLSGFTLLVYRNAVISVLTL